MLITHLLSSSLLSLTQFERGDLWRDREFICNDSKTRERQVLSNFIRGTGKQRSVNSTGNWHDPFLFIPLLLFLPPSSTLLARFSFRRANGALSVLEVFFEEPPRGHRTALNPLNFRVPRILKPVSNGRSVSTLGNLLTSWSMLHLIARLYRVKDFIFLLEDLFQIRIRRVDHPPCWNFSLILSFDMYIYIYTSKLRFNLTGVGYRFFLLRETRLKGFKRWNSFLPSEDKAGFRPLSKTFSISILVPREESIRNFRRLSEKITRRSLFPSSRKAISLGRIDLHHSFRTLFKQSRAITETRCYRSQIPRGEGDDVVGSDPTKPDFRFLCKIGAQLVAFY